MNVTICQLRTKADELEALNNNLKTMIDELEAAENRLNGMWDGEANEAFHNAFNSDKIQMINFYNLVRIYIYILRSIIARYQCAEAHNTCTATTRSY